MRRAYSLLLLVAIVCVICVSVQAQTQHVYTCQDCNNTFTGTNNFTGPFQIGGKTFAAPSGSATYAHWNGATVDWMDPVGFLNQMYYNVLVYGAKGDGVADDLAAIQATYAAAVAGKGGIVYFPPGQYKVSAAITITDCNGISLQGTGAYPSATARGTTILTSSTTADVIDISPSVPCGYFTISDLYIKGNSAGASGNGLVIDATTNTVDHFNLRNLVIGSNKQAGLIFKAGQGAGGFIFDAHIDHPVLVNNGTDGWDMTGQVSQIKSTRIYADGNAAKQIMIDGGTNQYAGSIKFDGLTTGAGATGLAIYQAVRVIVNGFYTESITVANLDIQSSRGITINGGGIGQSGTAKGVTFSNGTSSLSTQNVSIDLPYWTNTSSNTDIEYVSGTVSNVTFGDDANGPITRADVTGIETLDNAFTFRGIFERNTAPPTKCPAGGFWYDETGTVGGYCEVADTPRRFILSQTAGSSYILPAFYGGLLTTSTVEIDGSTAGSPATTNYVLLNKPGGYVGVNKAVPVANLDVSGTFRVSDQMTSTMSTGVSPFAVTSQTLNTNLNADMVDGFHASATPALNTVAVGGASGLLANGWVNWASPSAIGTGTPATITGTTVTANTGFVGPLNGTVGAVTPAAVTGTAVAANTSLAVGSGTAITKIVYYSPTLTPVAVGASTCGEQTFTVAGLTTADFVTVNGPSPAAGTSIGGYRVTGADTIGIDFCADAVNVTPTSGTYIIRAERH